jgi:WhiB family transcriptional regulator, redox-sensing transcriptional regulator
LTRSATGYGSLVDRRRATHDLDAAEWAVERREELERAVPFIHLLATIREGAAGDWADSAACKGRSDLMFPGGSRSHRPGLALCAKCPVLEECRRWANGVGASLAGIAAGETERERDRRRSRERRAA